MVMMMLRWLLLCLNLIRVIETPQSQRRGHSATTHLIIKPSWSIESTVKPHKLLLLLITSQHLLLLPCSYGCSQLLGLEHLLLLLIMLMLMLWIAYHQLPAVGRSRRYTHHGHHAMLYNS